MSDFAHPRMRMQIFNINIRGCGCLFKIDFPVIFIKYCQIALKCSISILIYIYHKMRTLWAVFFSNLLVIECLRIIYIAVL